MSLTRKFRTSAALAATVSDKIGLPPSRTFEFAFNAAIGPNYKFCG
jgi:hypothetical protein